MYANLRNLVLVSLSLWFESFQPDCRIVQYDDGGLRCHHCYRRGPEQCRDLPGKLGKEDPSAIRDILECKSGIDMIGCGRSNNAGRLLIPCGSLKAIQEAASRVKSLG
jgi:hypothetical protein